MSSTSIFKIFFVIFLVFALGEIIFTVKNYGLPSIDFFKPRPGSCKILEEKYCLKGKLNFYKINQDTKIEFVSFDLPKGTLIFSPVNGQYTKAQITQPSSFQGLLVGINPPDRSVNYNFTGDIELFSTDFHTQEAKSFGTIGNSGAKEFGIYNLIFTMVSQDSKTKKPIQDINGINKLFPYLKK